MPKLKGKTIRSAISIGRDADSRTEAGRMVVSSILTLGCFFFFINKPTTKISRGKNMSATNRGAERNKQDYYRTPEYIIRDFATWASENLSMISWWNKHDVRLVDPCAGGDPENPIMPYPEYFKLQTYKHFWWKNDIRTDSSAEFKEDFLDSKIVDSVRGRFDIVISNPPYNQAMQFIEKGLEMVKDGGYVIYLLRLNFFGAQSRKEFHQNNMPVYTIVSSKRPCFMQGASDSCEYAHFVWQKGNHPTYTKLCVI